MAKGLARKDYIAIGGSTPWQRHMAHQRPEVLELREADPPITEADIGCFQQEIGDTLALSIRRKFQLTRQQLSTLFKAKNEGKGKKQKTEYYVFLEELRDTACVPAMRDFAAELFPTMRQALLNRLAERGITLVAGQ